MKPRKHIHKTGTVTYMLNGLYHRLDGPAIEATDGTKKWYVDGCYHRLDGPAIEYADGDKRWWINDIEYNTELEYWIAIQNYVDNTKTV